MSTAITPPPRASESCRHYSYERGESFKDGGPRCEMGIDLSVGSVRKCLSSPDAACPKRTDFTAEERAASDSFAEAGTFRLFEAIGALPKAIPLQSSGSIPCPNCGGVLTYSRWHRGAGIKCATPHCCEARLNIKPGVDWP
jgi:hypothetical protein